MNRPILFAALVLGASGCAAENMTNAEVLEALEESRDSSRGEDAAAEPIEISTEFTIGQAVEAAAEELAAWWESQQPCTEITWTGAEIEVDYGGLDDTCEFNGKTYGGIALIGVDSAQAGQLQVTHTWDALTNGDVEVNGGAVVTWDGIDDTRHVVTEHTWTALDDGATVDVEGDHIWGNLDADAGWLGGFTLEGTRDWHSDSGDWHVDMADLEIRLQDPVAQAGTVTLTNPDGKTIEMLHERQDETTIRITITQGTREWLFDINQLGIPSEVDDSTATGT